MQFLAAALPLLALAAAADAQQRRNNDAPIDFGADRIELQDKQNRAVLSGNVAVRQAEMTLNAARVTIAYTGSASSPQASRVDAAGNVLVRRPDQVARSQFAVYDVNSRIITMLGNVSLTQGGGNTVNGGRLSINLDTGRAVIDGSSVRGGASSGSGGNVATAPSGRVTGTFSVPKRGN